MENSHIHEHCKDSEATVGIYGILNKADKGENRVLDFRTENGLFTIEEEANTHGG